VLGMTSSDVKLIPGHGPISTPADLRKYVDMLKETRALVAQAAKDGKSVEEMKKEKILSKYDELGKGFIKTEAWIDVLQADLQHKGAADPAYQQHGHANEK
jgi:cyclase